MMCCNFEGSFNSSEWLNFEHHDICSACEINGEWIGRFADQFIYCNTKWNIYLALSSRNSLTVAQGCSTYSRGPISS